jgi:hypothetical protein
MNHDHNTTNGQTSPRLSLPMSTQQDSDLHAQVIAALPGVWASMQTGSRIPDGPISHVAAGALMAVRVAHDPVVIRHAERLWDITDQVTSMARSDVVASLPSELRVNAGTKEVLRIADSNRDEMIRYERQALTNADDLRQVFERHPYSYDERQEIVYGYRVVGETMKLEQGQVQTGNRGRALSVSLPAVVTDVQYPFSRPRRVPPSLDDTVKRHAAEILAHAKQAIGIQATDTPQGRV